MYTLHSTKKQFSMKVTPLKSKIITFEGHLPIRSTIVTNYTT